MKVIEKSYADSFNASYNASPKPPAPEVEEEVPPTTDLRRPSGRQPRKLETIHGSAYNRRQIARFLNAVKTGSPRKPSSSPPPKRLSMKST